MNEAMVEMHNTRESLAHHQDSTLWRTYREEFGDEAFHLQPRWAKRIDQHNHVLCFNSTCHSHVLQTVICLGFVEERRIPFYFRFHSHGKLSTLNGDLMNDVDLLKIKAVFKILSESTPRNVL